MRVPDRHSPNMEAPLLPQSIRNFIVIKRAARSSHLMRQGEEPWNPATWNGRGPGGATATDQPPAPGQTGSLPTHPAGHRRGPDTSVAGQRTNFRCIVRPSTGGSVGYLIPATSGQLLRWAGKDSN